MKALLIDAYDSFSHIIYQYLRMIDIDTEVVRSGELAPVDALAHESDFVLLGPGPGTPEDSGHVEMVRELAGLKPVFGSLPPDFRALRRPTAPPCLRRPTRCTVRRARLTTTARASSKASPQALLPRGITFADCRRTDRSRRAAGHRAFARRWIRHGPAPQNGSGRGGVQFHPESILTADGIELFRNFTRARWRRAGQVRAWSHCRFVGGGWPSVGLTRPTSAQSGVVSGDIQSLIRHIMSSHPNSTCPNSIPHAYPHVTPSNTNSGRDSATTRQSRTFAENQQHAVPVRDHQLCVRSRNTHRSPGSSWEDDVAALRYRIHDSARAEVLVPREHNQLCSAPPRALSVARCRISTPLRCTSIDIARSEKSAPPHRVAGPRNDPGSVRMREHCSRRS